MLCAVEAGSSACLPIVLRWAHAAGSLAVLCNHPAYFSDDVWHLAVLDNAIRVAVAQAFEGGAAAAAATLKALLHTPLHPVIPLSANQKMRLLEFMFETGHEASLNSYLHRFPDLTKKIDAMAFPTGSLAESLRRRCIYRLMYEPADDH